jgi:hypothetical protein
MALVIIVLNIRNGVVFATKWLPWAKPNIINRFASLLRLGLWGPRPPFPPDYGFIPVTATPVSGAWHGGDGGEANSRNF